VSWRNSKFYRRYGTLLTVGVVFTLYVLTLVLWRLLK